MRAQHNIEEEKEERFDEAVHKEIIESSVQDEEEEIH